MMTSVAVGAGGVRGGGSGGGVVVGGGGGEAYGKGGSIEVELRMPLELAERLCKACAEAESFKSECSEVRKLAESLLQMLRFALRLASSSSSSSSVSSSASSSVSASSRGIAAGSSGGGGHLYDRPVRRIAAEAAKALDRALALVRRCKRRSGILSRVVTITTGATDFRKALSVLEASVGDMKWLLSVFSAATGSGGIVLSLPPIASTYPILSWVWSYVAVVQMATGAGDAAAADRAEAANALANLALDNDRNKKIIVEEGGVPPLLALLRDGSASTEAQLAAATALCNLADNQERVLVIVAEMGIPVIVQALSDSPMRLQARLASLVARMAAQDPIAQEEFARENCVRPLVTLLSADVLLDDHTRPAPNRPTSIHSLVQANREQYHLGTTSAANTTAPPPPATTTTRSDHVNSLHHQQHHHQDSIRIASSARRERENESAEVKLQLKTCCAEALWRLSAGSVSNSRKITETKGLLCLAKIVERERSDLQLNCLNVITEIAAVAESEPDLRRSAFRMNSPAAKAVVDQLLRVVQEVNSPALQILAIRSLGSLARTFSARETRVVQYLVLQLSHWNSDVGTETAIALGKFACPDNFLCAEHCKTIIEFGGVPALMRLLRLGDKPQINGLALLCYLALRVGDSEVLERERVLPTLLSAKNNASAQHSPLRELLQDAIRHLELYHAGSLSHG
ncbi:hypothetical protein Taro_030892 [Colocasia esculenta]|uniref:DUF7792 domain-containing protein n=1 Tax=Colocasia esculenta TaxID=4460 RepID=A0A843W1I9_COLES|nr:hypothetical protein [Colocasia esculenta]